MKLRELAERLACQFEGDGDVEVHRVAGIEDAGPGDLTFLANPKYRAALRITRASAVILADAPTGAPCAVLRSAHPYLTFARAVALFSPATRPAPGVHRLAAIADDARLGRDVAIAPFVAIDSGAVIGDRVAVFPNATIGAGARIGDDGVIHAGATIGERCVLGARVIVQAGAVIGSDGYGFARRPDGTHEKIPQAGLVVIEDDVEIGANTTIDRPAFGATTIKAGAKIDNLVQVAHGVQVGRNVLLAAQVGIAGSSRIEDDVVLGGQVGVAGHLTIGRGARATAQTGIPHSVDAGAFVSGYPAIDNRAWLRASAVFRRLPELKKAVAALEARLAELDARVSDRETKKPPTE